MAVSPISSRMRRMQWIAVGLVTAAIALNYVDRSTLAVGNVKIREEFGISATAIGALQSAWSITYALCQVPIGYFLDRLGPRWLVGVALVLWSLAQAAGGLAVSYMQLLWARVALGAAECPAFPAAVRVTSDWFHVKDRGRPTGVYNSGGSIGPFIAPPLLTGLMLAFGWRTMFITMGVVGVLGALVWFKLYRDPATDRTRAAGPGVSRRQPCGRGHGRGAQLGPAVPLPVDVGPDAGRVLHRLCGVDVPDLAACLSRDAAAHQHRQDRLPGVDPAVLLDPRRVERRLVHRSAERARHGSGREPPAALDHRTAAVGAVHRDRDDGRQSHPGHRVHLAGDVSSWRWASPGSGR